MERLEEREAVEKYLENNSTGDTYLEGSRFEKDKPLFRLNWPNF